MAAAGALTPPALSSAKEKEMAIKRITRGNLWPRLVWGLAGVAFAEDVKTLQTQYLAERSRAEAVGWLKKFSPELTEQADRFALKGEGALAAGRISSARQLLLEARRLLPAPHLDFPEHVSRVFGNPKLRHGQWILAVAFSPDGTRLAAGGGTSPTPDRPENGVVRLWDSASGRELLVYRGHTKPVRTIAFSQDGKSIASAGGDPAIRIWDPATGKDIRQIPVNAGEKENDYVARCAFSPDGKSIAVASGPVVEIFEVATGNRQRKLEGHTQTVFSVTYSADGHALASASGDHTVRIWDTRTWKDPQVIAAHAASVLQVVFSPDGKSVATCGAGTDKAAKIFDLAKEGRDPQVFLEKSQNGVHCIALSKDGRTLATGGYDHVIRLWDVATAHVIRTIQGHSDQINSVAFSPDGSELASGGADQTVRLWPIGIVEQQREYLGHQNYVWSAAYSPDGSRIVSASADNTVKVWDTASAKFFLR